VAGARAPDPAARPPESAALPDPAARAPVPPADARARAQALDADDPLARFRERFVIDDGLVYLDGNSLGRPPRATLARLRREVEEVWARRLIRGWEDGWMALPVRVGDELAAAALGAAPGQVIVADSTTVCLYKLAAAALDVRPGRRQIVTSTSNFPTDRYVLEGLASARGLELVWLEVDPLEGPTAAQLEPLLGEDTALVSLSHVDYRSAFVADIAAISALAHDAGALVLFDLCHSVGALPVALDAAGVDLAVGCTYKYLGAGPGAPAFMYARAALQERLRQPIWGWLGRRDPFGMGPGYEPAAGVAALISGTPPVLGLCCVQEGVAVVAEAGIAAIREKGVALTSYLIELVDTHLRSLGVRLGSPRDRAARGSHVALAHPAAERLCAQLGERGVIVDFRQPDLIRVGLSPLSTRFCDVWEAVAALRELLAAA
jgi:kynureninase